MPLTVGGGIREFTDSNGVYYSALEVAAEYFRWVFAVILACASFLSDRGSLKLVAAQLVVAAQPLGWPGCLSGSADSSAGWRQQQAARPSAGCKASMPGTHLAALPTNPLAPIRQCRSGADKVSIGSDAVYAVEEYLAGGRQLTGKTAIEQISRVYGAQAVVISIDPRRVYVADPKDTHHAVVKTSKPGG